MKKISIRVLPNAKKARITDENGKLKVYVTSPAIEGRANEAVIEALVQYFNVKKRAITIIAGQKSRNKTIGITVV